MHQPLHEARELAESSYNLRADLLRELLQHCTSVRTVRLCLQLGRELSLPWAGKLGPALLPTGRSTYDFLTTVEAVSKLLRDKQASARGSRKSLSR